jgi:hypothetical protein
MEINRFEDVLGVVPTADIVEGRFILLCPHTFSYDFNSREDLAGAKVPATAEEATRAKYVITFSPDNGPTPFYEPMPAYTWAMRGGWSQTANAPFAATVYVTHRSNQECLTIPSGLPCLAFTDGTFTIHSGCYIYSAGIITIGSNVVIANTAEDGANAGMPKYQAAKDARVIGQVERYDSSTGALTIRVDD